MHPSRIFILSMIAFASCKSPSFTSYFPVQKDKTYTFLKHIDSTNQSFTETLICRETNARVWPGDRHTFSLVEPENTNPKFKKVVQLYYFQKPTPAPDSTDFRDNSFTRLLYCFQGKKVYKVESWSKDLQTMAQRAWLLFPKKLKPGIHYKYRNGDYHRTFVYIGKEPTTVNGIQYKDCIKMDVFETFYDSRKTGTVWLAKNTGVVRWDVKNEQVTHISRQQWYEPDKY